MDSTEAMNRILSNACPLDEHDDGTREYVIELHCVLVKIVATATERVVENGEWQYTVFDIDSIEFMEA